MKKLILTATIFLALLQSLAFCQTGGDLVTTAINSLKSQLTDHMIEKAYLHFDRPYPFYVAGEMVYFKAYVFTGERHELSAISKVLHVDLIDKNNVLLQSIPLQLTDGIGWGNFTLPATLEKGVYRIRAYTEWMRNDKTPYFFDQYLSVNSVNNGGNVMENTAILKPDLQFFPEGGNMIVDLPVKVAYKAIGSNGLGTNVKGIVIDNEHKEVAQINAAHLGMGEFSFIPEEGHTYKANVTFADGSQSSIALPAPQPKGIGLSVNTDDPAKVSIEIRANRPFYKENGGKQLNLLIYYAGALKEYKPILDNAVLGVDLPANTFPTGIIKVSLLSATGEPLAERLAFIQNPDLLNLSIAAGKPLYNTREHVKLDLNAKNKDGNPVAGSFSISVVDESKILVEDDAENSILSDLLLTTEVKGFVEKPNFYFSNVNKDTRTDLDILMLTQGFRRFEWKELESGALQETANAFAPEKEIAISGVLKNKAGVPIPDCTLLLLSRTGGSVQTQNTDKDGRFRFTNVDFSTGTKFVLKAESSSGKKGVLTLDKPGAGPVITPGSAMYSKYNPSADILASGAGGQGTITAANTPAVVAAAGEQSIYQRTKNDYRSSSLEGPGHADQVILSDVLAKATSLSTALNGRLIGVTFNGDVPYLKSSQAVTFSGSIAEPMLIYIDGVNMGSGTGVDVVNPVSVEAVEILKGPNTAIYGVQAGAGVLIITTKQGTNSEAVISTQTGPGIFSIEPRGYFKAREFYSPKYTADHTSNGPDNRTTIFWKPDAITDSGGNASFDFFNADGKGTYRVEVEGVDSKGNIGMQVIRYKVQ